MAIQLPPVADDACVRSMPGRILTDGDLVKVIDYRCEAGPGDPSFVEHHDRYTVSYVREGAFGYRVGSAAASGKPSAHSLQTTRNEFRSASTAPPSPPRR